MAGVPPACDFGAPAPDFALPDAEGRRWSRDALRGPNGLLLVFICNHCPYVLAIADKLASEGQELQAMGFGVAAINSNDPTNRPADSYDNMGPFARRYGFAFPYLHDADQSLARACGAVCTPDFFGYNADLALQYRGRLDSSGRNPDPAARRELHEAMALIASTGQGPRDQTPSIGCTIKWTAE